MLKFKNNLILYVRFIDVILGVWKETNENPTNFKRFKLALNKQYTLKLKTKNLIHISDPLDVAIAIKKKMIVTKTFQKLENLYLCITFNSAPPGQLISLVTGRLGT